MDNIDEIFKNRLSILESSAEIYKHGVSHQKSSSGGQMSLFGAEDTLSRPKIKYVKQAPNRLTMALNEAELVGTCVSYDYMEKYLIHSLVYVTHSIQQVNELTENTNGIIIIGLVTNIEYKKSFSGNDYMKLSIVDKGSEVTIFLNGKSFKDYSGFFIKNNIYMLNLKSSGEKNYLNLISAVDPDNTVPDNKYSHVTIEVTDFKYVKSVRDYIHRNMIYKGNKSLSFMVEDKEYPAPYKIAVSNDNLIKLKEMKCVIKLIK